MTRFLFIFLMQLATIGCEESAEVLPSIVGKWEPTYEIQNLNQDGSWSGWITINTLVPLPSYEFTSNGRFLYDGKIEESCCLPGSLYTLEGDKLTFKYENAPDCSTVKCAFPNEKTVVSIDGTNLVLIEQIGRIKKKYRRAK